MHGTSVLTINIHIWHVRDDYNYHIWHILKDNNRRLGNVHNNYKLSNNKVCADVNNPAGRLCASQRQAHAYLIVHPIRFQFHHTWFYMSNHAS